MSICDTMSPTKLKCTTGVCPPRLRLPIFMRMSPSAKLEEEQGTRHDVVICERACARQLLALEAEALLVRGDAGLLLDFGLDVVDGLAPV